MNIRFCWPDYKWPQTRCGPWATSWIALSCGCPNWEFGYRLASGWQRPWSVIIEHPWLSIRNQSGCSVTCYHVSLMWKHIASCYCVSHKSCYLNTWTVVDGHKFFWILTDIMWPGSPASVVLPNSSYLLYRHPTTFSHFPTTVKNVEYLIHLWETSSKCWNYMENQFGSA
jgi:hypothetical protein